MGTKTEQIAPTGELLRLDPTTGALRARDYTVSVAGPDARRTLPLEDRMTVGTHADWATLLRRTFDVDVTRCTGCAGRMTVRAVVTDPASIDRLLAALRRARDPPVAA